MSNNWSKPSKNTLMIVDGSNLAFRFFKRPLAMETEFIKTINSLKASYCAKDVIVLFDYGTSTYRKSIYPEYKENREVLKEKRTDEEKEKWTRFFDAQVAAAENIRQAFIPVIREYGVEADDIAAWLCKEFYDQYDEIKLISGDKDWLQLLDHKVSCFSFTQAEERDIHWMAEKYGCTPKQFLNALILAGDTSDNVPGIKGLGEPKHDKARSIVWAKRADTLEGIIAEARKEYKKVIAGRIVDGEETIALANSLINMYHAEVLTYEQMNRITEELREYDFSC